MVITMVTMLIMQPPIHDVAHMIAMWHRFMATALAMNVVLAVMSLVAFGRIGWADF